MTVHIYNIYKAGGEKYIHKAGKWADAGSEDEEQPGVRKKMREPVAFVFLLLVLLLSVHWVVNSWL